MVIATAVLALAATQDLSANEQNTLANLLFVAAQVISTRASLLPSATGTQMKPGGDETASAQTKSSAQPSAEERISELERRLAELTGTPL